MSNLDLLTPHGRQRAALVTLRTARTYGRRLPLWVIADLESVAAAEDLPTEIRAEAQAHLDLDTETN
jgi:hypothetical protein